MKTATTHCLFY